MSKFKKTMLKYENFLIIVSAPSGTGKSTLINKVLETETNIKLSVSATTRDMRAGEQDKVHYYFLKKEEFENRINNNEFLEYADVFGNYYGTLKSQIEEKFQDGKDVFLDIDYQGAEKITQKINKKQLLKIFILPPSMNELKKRLIERGRDKPEDIEKRLAKAKLEIKQSINYDYVVVNDNFDETVQNIKSIIQTKRIKNSEGENLNKFIEENF